MNKVVLDTSAVLAYLFQEAGADQVLPVLEAGSGVMSSVNYAELVGKLADQGMPVEIVRETLFDLELEVIDYDEKQAFETGVLRTVSKAFGLSLGDRACLALAVIKKLPVLTADRIWLNVPVPTEVRSIRG
jgi:ribonuclease VapC